MTQTAANEIQPNLRLETRADLSTARDTILVVEDEAFVREAASDILEREVYRVLRACNAAEAQEAFRRQHVQLLLSDVVLPGQNGPALAKDLRATRPSLKAIFISGYPGVFTLATLLVVASSAPCSTPKAPVAIESTPLRLPMLHPFARIPFPCGCAGGVGAG